MDQTQIRLIDFDDLHLTDQKLTDISDATLYRTTESKTWINVNGLHDVTAIGNIGQTFDLHPLVPEDILNTGQRPKIDDYESYVYIVLKMIRYDQETSYLRKSIRPAREAIFQLSRLESDLILEETRPFFKDMEDLIIHATEAIDTYRELLTDQLNIYNSVVANKMNDIMKVLTIFAAVFIPLTFIAGVYGTNFEYLPELKYKYSYFIFWGVLVFVAGASLYYFKKKKWF
jgi:Mg2+ and Co2+ transporter CorA